MSTPEFPLNNGAVAVVEARGPDYQYQVPGSIIAAPATIAASGTFALPLIELHGMRHVAVAAKLTTAGTITLQRYLDNAGSLATGSAVTQAMTGGTLAVLDNLGTIIAQSFIAKIINGGTAAGTLTSTTVVMQSE